ncbi:MAG: M20 family metallopeptidase [Halobacteriota archaeon]
MSDEQDGTDPDSLLPSLDRDADLTDLFLDLLSFPTPNPPGDTTDIADYVATVLEDADIPYEAITSDPTKPNVVATIPGDRDETLLFNGHLDTVPFDAEDWEYDPLGEQVDDRIYGRGATDMKGALAAMLIVARSFARSDESPPLDLQFAFVSDEEVPSDAGLGTLLEESVIDVDACLIGENTCMQGRHSVTVADRGSIWLTLQARGESAHGSRPMLGANAIDRLYAAIDHLRTSLSNRPLRIDETIEPIIDESVAFYAPLLGETEAERLFRYPTVNLGTLEGGTAINTVPESAIARVDVRLTATVDTATVLSDIRDCLAGHEHVSIVETSWSTGTFEAPDGPLVSAVAETAASVVEDRIYRRSATGGGDVKQLRDAGISTVEFALGTDTAHAADEYLPREALLANAEIYARVPFALARRFSETVV